MDKERKKYIEETKSLLYKIMKACDDYDQTFYALKEIFTHLMDKENPRFEEFNNTYIIKDIAQCDSFHSKRIRVKKALERTGNFQISFEIYFYDKAPNGIVISLALFAPQLDKQIPLALDLFIDEREKK